MDNLKIKFNRSKLNVSAVFFQETSPTLLNSTNTITNHLIHLGSKTGRTSIKTRDNTAGLF